MGVRRTKPRKTMQLMVSGFGSSCEREVEDAEVRAEPRKTNSSMKVCLECPLKVCVEETGDTIDLSSVNRNQLAKAVFVGRQHISGVLMGKNTPSLPLAYDISRFLGCSIDHLFQAISGANGQNPARRYRTGWRDCSPAPPKYLVDGKGYPNLREAVLSLGIEMRRPTDYRRLPKHIRERITQNRKNRGR